MENIEDTVVHWPTVRIIAHGNDGDPEEYLIPHREFKWNGTFGDQYLTLKEIASQLSEMGHSSPYYVWYELGLSGTIYLYGNYLPKEWVKHGTTKGYA